MLKLLTGWYCHLAFEVINSGLSLESMPLFNWESGFTWIVTKIIICITRGLDQNGISDDIELSRRGSPSWKALSSKSPYGAILLYRYDNILIHSYNWLQTSFLSMYLNDDHNTCQCDVTKLDCIIAFFWWKYFRNSWIMFLLEIQFTLRFTAF